MNKPKKKEYLLKYIIVAIIILSVALLAPINNIIRLILTIISLIILSIFCIMSVFGFAKIRIYDNLSELLKQIPKRKKDYFA